jgi:hypothetical protein
MLLLLIRSFSAALLILVDFRFFLCYTAIDHGVYLFQKICRGDFYHWLPLDGLTGFFMSLLERVICKTICDYTGVVQFRASAEMGGIYWSINLCLAIPVSFAAAEVYFTLIDDVVISEKTVREILGWLSCCWIVSFVIFIKLMKEEYRITFFSVENGCDWAMSFFLKGDSDDKKVKPLRLNKNKWIKIRPEMKQFVLSNWVKWEDEKPEFFNEQFKICIPDDMLPDPEVRRQQVAGGGKRRKSSLAGMIGGDLTNRRKSSVTVVPFNEGIDT